MRINIKNALQFRTAHRPNLAAFEKASNASLEPQKLEGKMAFMFESRYIIRPIKFAMEASQLQHEYFELTGTTFNSTRK